MDRIGLVIPTYNEEKYIVKLFESLERSTIYPDEVIIVDDQSTDRTREIAKSYGAEVVLVDKKNIGYARKIGMLVAKHNILVSGSADMVVSSLWLERLTAPIKSGYDVSFGRIDVDSQDVINKSFAKFINNYSEWAFRLFRMVWASGDNIAISRPFYHKIGGFKELKMGEDIELIKRAIRLGKVYYAKDAVIYTSDRRVKRWGKIRFFLYYLTAYVLLNTGKVIDVKDYEPVR